MIHYLNYKIKRFMCIDKRVSSHYLYDVILIITTRSTVLHRRGPWRITCVNPPTATFRAFYQSEITPELQDSAHLTEVYVGKSKELVLDSVVW